MAKELAAAEFRAHNLCVMRQVSTPSCGLLSRFMVLG